jgi:Carbohydrate-selective porin, OprB family
MVTTSRNRSGLLRFIRSSDRLALACACVLLLPALAAAQAGGAGAAGGQGAAGGGQGTAGGQTPPAGETTGAPATTPPPPAGPSVAAAPAAAPEPQGPWEQWAAWKDKLRKDYGTSIALNNNITYRAAVAGPEDDVQRPIYRYDLLLQQHFQEDSMVSMDVRGGWGDGLDPIEGNFANTDQYATAGSDMFILHLYYEQKALDEQLTMRIGKFDIGDWIDTNRYGYYNFVGYSFAHNSTIPLTGNTWGAMATWEPNKPDDWYYISGGSTSANMIPQEGGFNKIFESDAPWLVIGEFGLKPVIGGQKGVYRITPWYNSKDFTGADGSTDSGAMGISVSFDQDLTEQVGLFARFGTANDDPFEPKYYYSGGILLKEPFAGRKDDSVALGVVVNQFTSDREDFVVDSTSTETYFELYYNLQLTPWAQIQPVAQVILDPGGTDRDTEVILGVHVLLAF